jgi:hypothetical protein
LQHFQRANVTFANFSAAQTVVIAVAPFSNKIVVRPEMLINEAARGNAFELFDEQTLVGALQEQPKTAWNDGYNKLYYPLTAVVDLGAEYQLSDILLYDGAGTGDFRVERGTPFSWLPLLSDSLTNYQKWNRHTVNVRTRYLRLVVSGPETRVPEVALYGKPLGPIQTVRVPTAVKNRVLPTME